MKKISEAKLKALIIKKGMTEAARESGIPKSTLYGFRDRGYKYAPPRSSSAPKKSTTKSTDGKTGVQRTETDDSMEITYHGERWLSADEIVQALNVDLGVWKIDKIETRAWEVTGKKSGGQEVVDVDGDEALKWAGDSLWKSKNRYINIRLSRKAPKKIQDAIKDLLSRGSWPSSPKPKKPKRKSHVMEISLYDLHLGKYCFAPYTGDNYDNAIAQKVFLNAADDLLRKTEHVAVSKIIFPLGHDFFQVNNWVSETARGTRVDSSDDRFTVTFEAGVNAVRHCLNKCLEVAPVEVLYVPGNHDPETSFYLCKVLESMYTSNKHIQVDTQQVTGHKGRKYRRFGSTLLGYVHGAGKDCPKDQNLPLLMATERPHDWSATTDRAFRLGHLHTKKTGVVPIGDIFNGVRIERMPSLSGCDAFHFDNGFTGNRRAAEAWLWSYDNGLEAQFTTYAKES